MTCSCGASHPSHSQHCLAPLPPQSHYKASLLLCAARAKQHRDMAAPVAVQFRHSHSLLDLAVSTNIQPHLEMTESPDSNSTLHADCTQAAVSEQSQMAALLLGLEIALYLSNRLQVHMGYWATLPATPARANLEACLIEFPPLFLARAIRIY